MSQCTGRVRGKGRLGKASLSGLSFSALSFSALGLVGLVACGAPTNSASKPSAAPALTDMQPEVPWTPPHPKPAPLSAAEQRLVELGKEEPPPVVQVTAPKPSKGLTRGVADEADRLLALGDLALGREDYTKALEHYRQARRELPKHPAPIVGVVNARFGLLGIPTEYAAAPKDKRLAELFKLLDEASSLDPKFGQLALSRGRLLLVRGDAKEAASQLELALQALPDEAEAHSAAAVAALALGDVDRALSGFQRAVELDPNNPERLTNLGTAWMLKADATRAIDAFGRALGFTPDDPRALGNMGTALLAAGQVESALTHLTRAHELAPTRATFMSNLGYAHQLKGDLVAAEDWCRKAIKADPKLGSAWINLGLVLAAQKQWAAAERAFKEAQKLDPSDPRVIANLEDLKAAKAAAP